jgi:multidrug efflux system outer membrane protein
MVLAAALALSGCMAGPNYVRPRVEQPLSFKSQPAGEPAPPIAQDWWKLYGSPELDTFIATALESNQTLRQAAGRVDEARAYARIAASYLSPTISLDPGFTRQRTSANSVSTVTGQKVQRAVSISDWLVPFDLSYEADVWGRIRRSLESAAASAAASAFDLTFVRLTVETDVAEYYFNLRSLDAQSRIVAQTVAAYQDQVRLVSVQLKNGLISPIVLYQAQVQLEAAIAQQRDLERARADEEHALAILCGHPAPSFSVVPHPLGDVAPPSVPPGIPAQLLTRRPDVAEAEQNLIAANAGIGVATADFYPRFTLNASAGLESASYSTLLNWQSRVASIVPAFTLPVFTGGRLKANLDAAKARYDQSMAAYVNQVLIAYGDVEDALTDLQALTNEVEHLHSAAEASEGYLRLAQVQYERGLADYLLVTDAEAKLLANQLSLAQAINLRMAASIRLIKALGGGW